LKLFEASLFMHEMFWREHTEQEDPKTDETGSKQVEYGMIKLL